jgi:hypothetical protein
MFKSINPEQSAELSPGVDPHRKLELSINGLCLGFEVMCVHDLHDSDNLSRFVEERDIRTS